ncbi:helix-turn-helix domain-containing protein [Nonomuraea sp. NBC_00507]|uniref:helix-turn-helix domain-containing protein n=1 Tax=Nonomuraea sp. NBC_00507 TaxID=2976002 RepID=UPI002E1722C5
MGQRIKMYRMRRGMSQEVLAGLVGKSVSWLKQVEAGRLQSQPKLSILLMLAEALHVRDLSELTGQQTMPVRMFAGPGHPALADVRAAINATPLLIPQGTVQPLNVLRARLDAAWHTRHTSPDHRTACAGVAAGRARRTLTVRACRLQRSGGIPVRRADLRADRRWLPHLPSRHG